MLTSNHRLVRGVFGSLWAPTLVTALTFATSSCKKQAPEPAGSQERSGASDAKGESASPAASPTANAQPAASKAESAAPSGASAFTLAEATKDLPGSGSLVARLETSKGTLKCKLFDDKAPVTVANFVGLATGKRSWRDPSTGAWVNRPAYDGTTFHRVIKGFMIQGGDASGDGTGEPGYVINDEIWAGAKHDRAGLLCMANRGPNTNGAQFFITDASTPHLDGGYTIFGECEPVGVVHTIANVTTGQRDRPLSTVTISKVTISRDTK